MSRRLARPARAGMMRCPRERAAFRSAREDGVAGPRARRPRRGVLERAARPWRATTRPHGKALAPRASPGLPPRPPARWPRGWRPRASRCARLRQRETRDETGAEPVFALDAEAASQRIDTIGEAPQSGA